MFRIQIFLFVGCDYAVCYYYIVGISRSGVVLTHQYECM